MPKDERFVALSSNIRRTPVSGADALRRSCRREAKRPPIIAEKIVEPVGHDADEITQEVLLAVRRTFITPFDRGDIKDLITSMDDAIDEMQKTAKTITLFELSTFEPEMREMGDAHRASGQPDRARPCRCCDRSASNAGQLNEITEEMTRIEGQADELHDAA